MKKLLKWAGIIIGVFIVLGIIANATGDKEGSSPAPAVSTAAQPSTKASPSPSASPTPSPAEKPAPTLPKVGERVESAGVALTVNAVSRATSLGMFSKAKEGNVFLVADVTIENTSRDRAPYNPLYFKVKDGDGYEYNTAFSGDEKNLKSGELASDEKARGTVAFEVPAKAKDIVLSYQPIVILGGYKVIRIALEP